MEFQKNQDLESLITVINDMLEPVEKKVIETGQADNFSGNPTLFLLGAPRSGSTLFTQWMASLEKFSYPSNFLSRFYKAPYVGALIYKMITDPAYQYRNEFSDINTEIRFSSAIGKTEGFKAPHEFWYFWRRFYEFSEIPVSEENFFNAFDTNNCNQELELLKLAFNKPFLFKAHLLNWYAGSLSQLVPNSLFIHLYRDPVASVRSLIKAREKWTGSKNNWFSFKPREYDLLKDMDVFHQVAGQIYFINKEILSKRNVLGKKYYSCSYEDFCKDPGQVYEDILSFMGCPSEDVSWKYQGPKAFEISNSLLKEDIKIKDAYSYFENKYGVLEFK